MNAVLTWIRNNKKIAVPLAVVGAVVLAVLAFGVFGIHTKFIDDKVSEDGPVFASGAASDIPSDVVDQETTDEMNDAMDDDGTPLAIVAEEPMPEALAPANDATENDATENDATENDATENDATESDATESDGEVSAGQPGEILTLVQGEFVDRSHPGSGVAKVLNDGTEQRFLRFEDFETDNGPDLFVYLTTADADASAGDFGVDGEFVNLGRLKGNVGEQNYEIPVDVDLASFDTVVVWCQRFSVAFTAADLG